MDEIEIDENSISFKLATKFDQLSAWEIQQGHVDSCQYNRAVIKGIGGYIMIVAIASVAGFLLTKCIVHSIVWAVVSLMVGFIVQPDTYAIATVMGTFVVAVAFLIRLSEEHPFDLAEVELYKAFKHRYCKRVTMKVSTNG